MKDATALRYGLAVLALGTACASTAESTPTAPSHASSSTSHATTSATSGSSGAGGDATPDPFNVPPGCTSGLFWMGGEKDWSGYPIGGMHPGMTCIGCHTNPSAFGVGKLGPQMWLAGTVYATAHEPDNCIGVDGVTRGATVVVTDANGQVLELDVGPTGNFEHRKAGATPPVAFPVHVEVHRGTHVRAMQNAAPSGDCNSCHTFAGAEGAPGRIVLP